MTKKIFQEAAERKIKVENKFRAAATRMQTFIANISENFDPKNSKEKMEHYKTLIGIETELNDLEKLTKIVWPEDEYIVEYSLEIGFLR